MPSIDLTHEQLKSILDYDSETGIFTWRYREFAPANWNSRWAGIRAGTNAGRYETIRLNGVHYLSHHLAWFYVYGYMPVQIEHENRNGFANWIKNLRESTQSQNMANRLSEGKVEKHGRKFRARVMVNRVKIELGSFNTEQEAIEAYWQGRRKYFGEFARVQ